MTEQSANNSQDLDEILVLYPKNWTQKLVFLMNT